MSIFPSNAETNPTILSSQNITALPLFKEYAWDFETGDFIYQNGKNTIVYGIDALKIWMFKALKTERYKYLAYTWDYGSELNSLIGQKYSRDFTLVEAERLLQECLLINPYIVDLYNIDVNFDNKTLHIAFTANTVYGEVDMNV